MAGGDRPPTHRGAVLGISQGYAFFAYPWNIFDNSGIRTLKGCRGLLAPLPGCDSWYVSLPGVRKKRVPLANLLAPLRGAEASVSSATLPFLRVYRAERTLKISKSKLSSDRRARCASRNFASPECFRGDQEERKDSGRCVDRFSRRRPSVLSVLVYSEFEGGEYRVSLCAVEVAVGAINRAPLQ